MTQVTTSQSKGKDSKVLYTKIMKDPYKKCNRIVISLDDTGEKILLQNDPVDNHTKRRFILLFLITSMAVLTFFTFMSLMLPISQQLEQQQQRQRQQQQQQEKEQQSSIFGVVMIDVNDKTVPNPNENPEKLEREPKTDGTGTRVLVYDGKQKYVTWPDPPPKDDIASVARYVMHISEFGSLATNSTHKGIEGYPFVNVFSVSDGPFNKSTGTPYFYFTPLELSVIDMKANNKVSLTVTEAQSDYCSKKGFDPEDPRCSHAIFTGVMEKIEKDTEEEEFARNALFSRHVEMSSWPSDHDWFFGKIKIQHIYLLDFFGGAQVVDVEEYFAANPFESKKKD